MIALSLSPAAWLTIGAVLGGIGAFVLIVGVFALAGYKVHTSKADKQIEVHQ
jgi:hypothetical protein